MDYQRARKTEEKGERRNAIVEVSKRLFASQGLGATGIDQIAAGCRLSRSLVYTYFLDKRHIFLAIVAEGLALLLEDFRQQASAQTDGLEAMAALGRAYAAFAQSCPESYEAIRQFRYEQSFSPLEPDGKKEELIGRFNQDLRSLSETAGAIEAWMVEQIERGIRDGSIRPQQEPLQTARALWAMVAGLIQASPGDASAIETGIGIAKEGLRRGVK